MLARGVFRFPDPSPRVATELENAQAELASVRAAILRTLENQSQSILGRTTVRETLDHLEAREKTLMQRIDSLSTAGKRAGGKIRVSQIVPL